MSEETLVTNAASNAQGLEHDEEKKHTAEIEGLIMKAQQALYAERSTETEEQTLERAMRDPEVAVRSCLLATSPGYRAHVLRFCYRKL